MSTSGNAATLSEQARIARLITECPQPLDSGPTRLIETHFSWVILTRHFAFKLKKALAVDWLRHDSVDERRLACLSEWHLNRRLAGPVYIGVIPIVTREDRILIANRQQDAEEYLLCMQRLPAHDSLQYKLTRGTVSAAQIQGLVRVLTHFYRQCPPEWIEPGRHHQALINRIRAHAGELAGTHADRACDAVRICDELIALAGQLETLITERVRLGWIREIHGDLRPEHIYLRTTPIVIDCLEFSRELRLLDPVDEIAFLAMECDRAGAVPLGKALQACYQHLMPDRPPEGLWQFYKASRAVLWAVLGLRHQQNPEQWRQRAIDYLRLARGYLDVLG